MKHLKIAATADGGFVIEGYGVPFGGPIKGRDLHGQFFSKKTDFALDLIPDGQRPLLFQHGLDSSVDTAVIGRWGVKRIDDGGVWVQAQLDARSEYINEIKELVDSNALGFSSGTMGHLVKVAPKTGEILKWALVELSLTPNPANPNAYIVRGNKSASAHVKSLFATKHGDHDQSEHGNWATGGGSDKDGDKDKTVHDAYARREHNAQEARAEAKQGIDKAYEKSGLSRPGYLSALPEPGMTDKQAFDHGYKEGTAKPTLSYQEDRIRTTGELMQALGLWKAINEQDPLGGQGGDMHGREWLSATAATSAESDRAAADIHEDNNWHNSAAVLRAVAEGKEWLETHDYGKKSLKVKRSTKHGDHDQSEHGNWATGGGSDKEDKGARDTNRVERNRRSSGAWQEKFGKVGEYRATGETAELAKTLVSEASDPTSAQERVDAALHMASQWNAKGPVSMPNGQIPLHGRSIEEELAHRAELSPSEADKEFHINLLADLKGETPEQIQSDIDMDKFNDWMSGYDVPGMPKTLRVKRSTKHGDHDQSEHGNWASGGGDKGGDKTGNDEQKRQQAESKQKEANRHWEAAVNSSDRLEVALKPVNLSGVDPVLRQDLNDLAGRIQAAIQDNNYRSIYEAASEGSDLTKGRAEVGHVRSVFRDLAESAHQSYLASREVDSILTGSGFTNARSTPLPPMDFSKKP